MRKRTIRTVASITFIILLIAGLAAFNSWNSRIIYNSDNATGNTCGNLNNGGLFAEYKDKIYFANPYDQNHLYVMNSDCSNARKLNDDSVASLNVCGNYIYYVKNNFTSDSIGVLFRGSLFGLYRTDLNGENKVELYEKLSGILSLCGNYIYYQHYDDQTAFSLYKVKINGKEETKISDIEYNPASMVDGKIYFSNITDKSNHGIFTLDTKNNSISQYFEGNTYLADMQGNYLYYIDIDKGYSLLRVNTSNKMVEQLCEERVVKYNIYGNKIFYQVEGEHGGIYRMNVDGTQHELVASGNFTNIHCTSQYTFFQYFDNQGVLYRVPTSGPLSNVEEITIQ